VVYIFSIKSDILSIYGAITNIRAKFGVKNAIIFILPMVQKLHKFLCSLCGTQYGHIFNTTVFNFLE
jgi:hypothetical protein